MLKLGEGQSWGASSAVAEVETEVRTCRRGQRIEHQGMECKRSSNDKAIVGLTFDDLQE